MAQQNDYFLYFFIDEWSWIKKGVLGQYFRGKRGELFNNIISVSDTILCLVFVGSKKF